MKLKILLVPFAVVFSLVLIIGYIYPTWFGEDAESIKKIKIEIAKGTSELNTVKAKKDNANKLHQSLQENADLELLINKYYPNYRNDEDVVSNINNIAFSDGIFLKDMKVEYKKVEQSDDPIRVMAVPLQIDEPSISVATGADPNTPVLDESGDSLEDLAKAKIKFIEITLKIGGNYEQIKRFTTSLNRVGLLNNIQSFKIYRDSDSANAANKTELSEGASADSLIADIVVGFGYFASPNKSVSALLNSKIFEMNKFNFGEIDKYKGDLIGSYKQSEIGETGNQNPFLSRITTTQ